MKTIVQTVSELMQTMSQFDVKNTCSYYRTVSIYIDVDSDELGASRKIESALDDLIDHIKENDLGNGYAQPKLSLTPTMFDIPIVYKGVDLLVRGRYADDTKELNMHFEFVCIAKTPEIEEIKKLKL